MPKTKKSTKKFLKKNKFTKKEKEKKEAPVVEEQTFSTATSKKIQKKTIIEPENNNELGLEFHEKVDYNSDSSEELEESEGEMSEEEDLNVSEVTIEKDEVTTNKNLLMEIKKIKAGSRHALARVWAMLKNEDENQDLILYISLRYCAIAKHGIRSFLSHCLELIKNRNMVCLKYFEYAIPLLQQTKVKRNFVKELVTLWCSDKDVVRIKAFLILRKMAISDVLVLEHSLKAMYNVMVQFRVNAYNYPIAQFMVNCMSEMAGISMSCAFNHMFVSLRKLAMQLRSVTNGGDFQQVYNWQVLFSLKLWTKVVCTFDEEQTLKPLIYPLVQIMIGIIRYKPGSKHIPFRFNIIKMLIEISKKTNTFIPVSSFLLDMLNSMDESGSNTVLKPLDLHYNLTIPNQYIGTKSLNASVLEESITLFYEYFEGAAGSLSFPEMVVPAIMHLKKIQKRQISQLIEKLEENRKYVEQCRSKLAIAPSDIDAVNGYEVENPPLRKFVASRNKVKSREVTSKASFVETFEKEEPKETEMDEDESEQES